MNHEIKALMQKKGVRQWQLAEAVGISEFRFSRLMRHELPDDLKDKALKAVYSIAENREANDDGKDEN